MDTCNPAVRLFGFGAENCHSAQDKLRTNFVFLRIFAFEERRIDKRKNYCGLLAHDKAKWRRIIIFLIMVRKNEEKKKKTVAQK